MDGKTDEQLDNGKAICHLSFYALLSYKDPEERRHLKTLWEKEKMPIGSSFSFLHSVQPDLDRPCPHETSLTLYQTTNFGHDEIESICRRQNKCDSKIRVWNGTRGKDFWEREKMLITSIFSFCPAMFSEALLIRVIKS